MTGESGWLAVDFPGDGWPPATRSVLMLLLAGLAAFSAGLLAGLCLFGILRDSEYVGIFFISLFVVMLWASGRIALIGLILSRNERSFFSLVLATDVAAMVLAGYIMAMVFVAFGENADASPGILTFLLLLSGMFALTLCDTVHILGFVLLLAWCWAKLRKFVREHPYCAEHRRWMVHDGMEMHFLPGDSDVAKRIEKALRGGDIEPLFDCFRVDGRLAEGNLVEARLMTCPVCANRHALWVWIRYWNDRGLFKNGYEHRFFATGHVMDNHDVVRYFRKEASRG